ncbi:MAG: GMC family oxidoreductase [Desulfurococcales archaeon]|nr:GMC family oxidoreductase [Desulfurococcales archaeon]
MRLPGDLCSQPRITTSEPLKDPYDVVVIGSGAGGAVVAWHLASKGYRVVVFESGPEPDPRILLREHPIIRATRYYWDSGLTFTWGRPVISLPYGRVLGGTVTVNSGTLFRVPRGTLALWNKETGVSIDSAWLDRAYGIVEERLNVRRVPEELLGGNALVMRRGAEALGLNHGPVRRPLGNCRGMGECAFICPCDGKIDMRLSFLVDAVRLGARVYTNAHVRRIIARNGRAVGVKVEVNGDIVEVEARAVVVSAGALNTPRLLRGAGVRNKSLGQHLHIHPAAGVTGVMDRVVRGWIGTMQSYYVDTLLESHRTLLLATFPPPGVGYSAASVPVDELDKYPYMASIGVQTSDDGTGSLWGFRLAGVARYDLNPVDLERIIEGVRLSAEILFAASAKRVYPPLKTPVKADSMGELNRILEQAKPGVFKLSAYHPMSTARMASDDDAGVVDEGGRVYGFTGLYVADASILPSTTIVNPQLTINALSLLVAEAIDSDLGGPR